MLAFHLDFRKSAEHALPMLQTTMLIEHNKRYAIFYPVSERTTARGNSCV